MAVLRNTLHQHGFGFEPPAGHGATNFALPTRLGVKSGDLTGNGALDLAITNARQGQVSVWRNELVPGANRVSLDGQNHVQGVDFAIQLVNTPPTLDKIASMEINEDAPMQQVALTGITLRHVDMQQLRIMQNWENPLDVTGEGDVTALDVLTIINRINRHDIGHLPIPPTSADAPPPYYDVDGNDWVTPNDVLMIINFFNAQCRTVPSRRPWGQSAKAARRPFSVTRPSALPFDLTSQAHIRPNTPQPPSSFLTVKWLPSLRLFDLESRIFCLVSLGLVVWC